jgi:hypothetical protein
MIVVYLLSVLFIVYIFSLICAKIYSPFWFHQPVYHIYDIFRFSKQPYWKKTRPPTNGIFCDTKHIVTTSLADIKDETWTKVVCLVQGHYMDSEFILNHTSLSAIKKKVYGDSYVSCYYEDKIVQSSSLFIETMDTENVYGTLVSRPVVIRFVKYPENNSVLHEFIYICDHDKYKKKHISRNLIQTHIYQHSLIQPAKIRGYVFQKHTDLCKAVVPLVQYQTYTFVLRDTEIQKLPRNYSIRCLNTTHIDLWRGIYAQILLQFEVSLMPEFEFTLEWLKNERYTIYVTVYKEQNVEHVGGAYILENTYVSWDSENLQKPHMVRLAASVNFLTTKSLLFFRGFLNCLHLFLLDRKEFGILEIPCISDNDLILSKWQTKYEMRNVTESAYYLYNLIYPRSHLLGNQFFIL